MTVGTLDFLKRMESNYPNEEMVTMVNEDGALLLHETNTGTVFKQARRYEVIESHGKLKNEGFVVMNNIAVTDEGRPVFEHQFKNQSKQIKCEPGLMVYKLLRPLSSNTYVILTCWENEAFYQKWQKSDSFFDGAKHKFAGMDEQPKIFTSAPYVSNFTITT